MIWTDITSLLIMALAMWGLYSIVFRVCQWIIRFRRSQTKPTKKKACTDVQNTSGEVSK